MQKAKGQAELVEYVLTFLISTIVLAAIYFLALNIYNSQIRREITDQLTQIETQMLSSMVKLYNSGITYSDRIDADTAILLGTVDLNLPQRVARRAYEISLLSPSQIFSTLNVSTNITNIGGQDFSGARIVGRTTDKPEIEVSLNMPNIDVVAQGFVANGVGSTLSFYRANISGAVKNIITLGNISLIASITSVG